MVYAAEHLGLKRKDLKANINEADQGMEALERKPTELELDRSEYEELINDIKCIRVEASIAIEVAKRYSGFTRRLPHLVNHQKIVPLFRVKQEATLKISKLKATTEVLSDGLITLANGSRDNFVRSLPWHSKGDFPGKVSWKPVFQCLRLPNDAETWETFVFDPKDFNEWWWNKGEQNSGESNVWADLKKIAQKLINAVNLSNDMVITSSDLHPSLKLACMKSKVAVLYLMYLCSFSILSKDKIQLIFEVTAPVIYVVCKITTCAHEVLERSSQDLDGAFRAKLEKQLKHVIPLISTIQVFLLLVFSPKESLGASLDFNRGTEYADGLTDPIPEFSAEQIAKICEPILKETKLMQDASKMNGIVAQMRKEEHEEAARASEQDVGVLNPSTAVREEVGEEADKKANGDFMESLGLEQIHDLEKVELGTWLVGGSHGKVTMLKVLGEKKDSCYYAVKIPMALDDSQNRVEREAEIWSRLEHYNILPLLGYALLDSCKYPALVSPVCEDNLSRFLDRHRIDLKNPLERRSKLTEKRRFCFLDDIVNGLAYLHSLCFAYGDLRAVNILVRRDETTLEYYAVLADFGTSASMASHDIHCQNRSTRDQKTNNAWLSPELMSKECKDGDLARVSLAGDIWAFGCVMLEVQYGTKPYERAQSEIRDLLTNGTLPADKDDIDDLRESHWNLMSQCWECDPEKRITIIDLSPRISRLLDELP